MGEGSVQPEALELARFFELSSDLLATIDADDTFGTVSPSWEEALGWSPAELAGRHVLDLVHPEDTMRTIELLALKKTGSAEVREFENRIRAKDARYHWLQWNMRLVDRRWYASARDVTGRKWVEEQTMHDLVTGLPNRAAITQRLAETLARMERKAGLTAVLLIDLDGFKVINHGRGHDAGDDFLRAIAMSLREVVRVSGAVGRFGGDEFVILLDGYEELEELRTLAAGVLEAVQQPVALESGEASISASIGVAMASRPGVTAEAILREADLAMYRAKAAGGGTYEVFDSTARAEVARRVEAERELREAIDSDQFLVHYQPIVALPEMSVSRCEALVRWEHPSGGLLLPREFIPLAEETGLIIRLGEVVLAQACEQAHRWRLGGSDVGVTVNVSTRQLEQAGFVETVRAVLERTGLPGGSLCLEITETAIMDRPEAIVPTLSALHELDVQIAMDDFGSGYSSLAYLDLLPLDTIKIDRSFVAGILTRPEDRAIVTAILSLARETEMSVIAEGVETEALHDELVRLGCELGQGFLYDRPGPADQLQLDGYSSRVRPGVGDPLVIREFMRQIGIPARIGLA